MGDVLVRATSRLSGMLHLVGVYAGIPALILIISADVVLPRFLAPNDRGRLALSLHNIDGQAGDYRLTIEATGAVSLDRPVAEIPLLSDAERATLRAWNLTDTAYDLGGCLHEIFAAQAGLVTLGLVGEHFDALRSVLVYPGDYLVPRSTPLDGGGELEWKEARLGETWAGGSMVLSWPGVVDGGRLRDGPRSVVIHECAHKLDLGDGAMNGLTFRPTTIAHQENSRMKTPSAGIRRVRLSWRRRCARARRTRADGSWETASARGRDRGNRAAGRAGWLPYDSPASGQ